MIYIETRGRFGRQARFHYGPLPVRNCLDPVRAIPLQLPGPDHRSNWLQYLFTPGVRDVVLGRDLPAWAAPYIRNRSRAATQLIGLDGGGFLLLHLVRGQSSDATQISPYLWRRDRSLDEVATHTCLNRNLEEARQSLVVRLGLPLRNEHDAVFEALTRSQRTTRGELRCWLRADAPEAQGRLDCVLMRLLLARRVTIDLSTKRYGDSTVIKLGAGGVGYVAPLLSPHASREAA